MAEEKRGETFVMRDAQRGKRIEFSTFVLGLASTALVHLGAAPHPEQGSVQVSLELAEESIELLAMLREKTRGNLTPEEQQLFDDVLRDLRLRFVQARER